ncbi:DoxX family protein [Microbulbifer epialgicus]|uniref:DoxX-like family protein n=1 Tax=Microbulbifer epialgicus TaxID=393907 RepID=A0ABV4P5Z9_9GAMM
MPLDVGKYASWGLGLAFIFFSIGHFVKTEGMVEMLPTWIPYRLEIVLLTGVLELLVGISLFLSKHQKGAAKFAIIILITFFPANIYSAINGIGLGGHQWGPIYLLIRTPLQIILIAWAYVLCIKSYKKVLNWQDKSIGA